MTAYLGGSLIQTVLDNPITAYRQLVQQYARDDKGRAQDPRLASQQAKEVFRASPFRAPMSGLVPRLVGVGFKRIPKFSFLLGYSYFWGTGTPGLMAATVASICSAPFINPIRVAEKQQRAFFKQTGREQSLREVFAKFKSNPRSMFRGTTPLMVRENLSELMHQLQCLML